MNERDDLKALIESVIVNELDFEADVLMDALPIGVLGTDPLGYCTYSNDVFAQFLGVTTDQLIGLEHLRWGFPLLSDSKMLIPWLAVFFRHQRVTSLFVETSAEADRGTAIASTVENLFRVRRTADGLLELQLDRSRKGPSRHEPFPLPWES